MRFLCIDSDMSNCKLSQANSVAATARSRQWSRGEVRLSRTEGAADSLRHSAGDSASTLATFPLPARRAERADFPHSALVRDYPFTHSELGVCTVRRVSAKAFHRNLSG